MKFMLQIENLDIGNYIKLFLIIDIVKNVKYNLIQVNLYFESYI